ncbi:MAG: 4Fe-4S binding protein [Parabacteroides sp.]
MLRKIRTIFAILFFVCITLLFLDFTGVTHTYLGWMAKLQFLPALLALNVGVIGLLLVLTLIFGRIYCSVICPMGVFQDVIAWFGKRFRSKKSRKVPYNYSPAKSALRYGVLGVFILALIGGIGSLVALLAPYSAYGRIASNLFQPIYRWGNNLLASIAEHYESYTFYEVDVWMRSLPTLLIAVITLLVVGYLAARHGRTYCNTICPVGTVLGIVARFSLFRVRLDPEKCKQCSLCTRNCKAACLDYQQGKVDYSRCVTCGDCLTQCKHDALHYTFAWPTTSSNTPSKAADIPPKTNQSLRTFLALIGAGAVSALRSQTIPKATDVKLDGGLAPLVPKQQPHRTTLITPPGAVSARNLYQHCTGCQLCVSACPNQVLRPSGDLMTLMQPVVSYEKGYCRPECVKCSEVCPTGAIKPITVADKSAVHVGHAVWVKERCLPIRDGQACGNCARHCPTNAIQMVPIDANDPKSLLIPVVNDEVCIGCGACEHLCPSNPLSAIYVEGYQVQRIN